jgi:hypothetical protein
MALGSGTQLREAGAIKDRHVHASRGLRYLRANSTDAILGMVQGFFPYYSQDIREIVLLGFRIRRPRQRSAGKFSLTSEHLPVGSSKATLGGMLLFRSGNISKLLRY